jgi:hypothetical protein
MTVKSLFFGVLVIIGAWYATKAFAQYQTFKTVVFCAQEMDLGNRTKAAKSQDQQRQVLIDYVICVDRKLGFPATLFFNKDEAIASIKIENN